MEPSRNNSNSNNPQIALRGQSHQNFHEDEKCSEMNFLQQYRFCLLSFRAIRSKREGGGEISYASRVMVLDQATLIHPFYTHH